MEKFVLEHIQEPICSKKGWNNNCQYQVTLWGKEFINVCNCQPFICTNPSGIDLENFKKLILIVMSFITDLSKSS